jgi:SAM-dependent methyltransferase
MQDSRTQQCSGAKGRYTSWIPTQGAALGPPKGSAIDWRWKDTSVVPAYYERALAPMLGLPSLGARILEVGVGCGYVLSKLTLSCRGSGVGVDDDRDAIELSGRVAASFGAHVACLRGEGQRLPFAEKTFDLVFSQGLIEHFPRDVADQLVSEHVRVLRPEGILALSVPNLLNPFHTWLKWREGRSYRFHPERSYTPWGVAKLLRRHGIGVMGRDGYGLFWSLWHRRSRLAYYASATALRCGLGQEFETKLTPGVRAVLGMMTLVWGRRPSE